MRERIDQISSRAPRSGRRSVDGREFGGGRKTCEPRDFRNKRYEPNRWYHVWNRGAGVLFRDDAERRIFLDCFSRHLSPEPAVDARCRPLRWLREEIELGSYCLLSTHYHLLVRTGDNPRVLGELMQSVQGAFTRECRRRGRTEPIFEGRYQADPIGDRARLKRAAVYVHLNRNDDPEHPYCSYPGWRLNRIPAWLNGATRLIESIGGLEAHRIALEHTIAKRRGRREADAYADELAETILMLKSGR